MLLLFALRHSIFFNSRREEMYRMNVVMPRSMSFRFNPYIYGYFYLPSPPSACEVFLPFPFSLSHSLKDSKGRVATLWNLRQGNKVEVIACCQREGNCGCRCDGVKELDPIVCCYVESNRIGKWGNGIGVLIFRWFLVLSIFFRVVLCVFVSYCNCRWYSTT